MFVRACDEGPRWSARGRRGAIMRRRAGDARTEGKPCFRSYKPLVGRSGRCCCVPWWRGDLIKLLWWTGDGLCLLAKRLERGRFIWPQASSGSVTLTQAQLSMLLEGIDWRRPERTWRPQSAL